MPELKCERVDQIWRCGAGVNVHPGLPSRSEHYAYPFVSSELFISVSRSQLDVSALEYCATHTTVVSAAACLELQRQMKVVIFRAVCCRTSNGWFFRFGSIAAIVTDRKSPHAFHITLLFSCATLRTRSPEIMTCRLRQAQDGASPLH